jgi:hypothetical protein
MRTGGLYIHGESARSVGRLRLCIPCLVPLHVLSGALGGATPAVFRGRETA